VIIDNLNVHRVASVPNETDTPLIIDPYAVLTAPVSVQCLQAVAGRRGQISDLCRAIQLAKFPLSDAFDSVESSAVQPSKKAGGFVAAKRFDHSGMV
jgi:hypothetical protein